MGELVLLRHGESEWNKANVFTGWVNISLSPKGIAEAFDAGEKLAHLKFDVGFTSTLIRAQMTLLLALSKNQKSGEPNIMAPLSKERKDWGKIYSEEALKKTFPIFVSEELNERYYGELQGRNKEEVKATFGEDQFRKWRRSYDTPPPKGESLEMTAKRTLPYFDQEIIPFLEKGKRVIVSAHGNSLRSIVMEIERLSKEDVVALEIPTGIPLFYAYQNGKWSKT